MNTPKQLKYSVEHQWVKLEGRLATVGMTDFAQEELGEIVFVELPTVGQEVTFGEACGSVESVKTVSELYAPVTGKVTAVNEQLEKTPQKVNESPYSDGWMIVVEVTDEEALAQLWDAEKYESTYSVE